MQKKLRVKKIVAFTFENNLASQKALLKNNFNVEGKIKTFINITIKEYPSYILVRMYNKSRIVIIGGSGFLASHLIDIFQKINIKF